LRDKNEKAPRIAASSYLNAAPLTWSFTHGSQIGKVDLIDAVPSRCADMLAHAQVEAALVPAIEYQRIPETLVVSDVCVGSRRKAGSVILAIKGRNLGEVRRVALDQSSRTSTALVRIIFREFLGFEPEWTTSAPDLKQMLNENDGALIIGDPAMTLPRKNLHVFDLAALWREHTDLGFVFALWLVREGASARARAIDFAGARDEGLQKTEEIISFYEPLLNLPRSELKAYLSENICFSIDDEMGAGLNLFYKLANKHGIIPDVKPLKTI
jgi:chorismate dehydratase